MYSGLAIADIFESFGGEEAFIQHMPVFREAKRLKKEFIVNVCATILGDRFKKWVKERTQHRNEKVLKERNLLMKLDNDVFKALQGTK